MRTKLFLATVVALVLALPATAADKEPAESIKVDITGTLQTGIVAIGGETTGAIISAKGIRWEVALPKGADAGKLNGKKVTIAGTFATKAGVEIRQRSILTATTVKEAGEKDEEQVKVEIRGKLKTGLVAAGGATTGTEIAASGASWELDFGTNKEFRALAEKLNGKTALAAGTLELKKPVAAPPRPRWIVTVTSLKDGEAK